MVLNILVKRLAEIYRKLTTLLWLFFKIGPVFLLKWIFLMILGKHVDLKIEFIFRSKKVSIFLASTLTDIILLTGIFFL